MKRLQEKFKIELTDVELCLIEDALVVLKDQCLTPKGKATEISSLIEKLYSKAWN